MILLWSRLLLAWWLVVVSVSASAVQPQQQQQQLVDESWDSWERIDQAIGAIAALQQNGLITSQEETELIELAMGDTKDPSLLILTKHYFPSSSTSEGSVRGSGSGSGNDDLIKLRDLLLSNHVLNKKQIKQKQQSEKKKKKAEEVGGSVLTAVGTAPSSSSRSSSSSLPWQHLLWNQNLFWKLSKPQQQQQQQQQATGASTTTTPPSTRKQQQQ